MLVTCKCVNILICQMWTSGVTLTEHTTPQPRVRSLYELGNRSALYMDTGSSNNKYTVLYLICLLNAASEKYFQRIRKKCFCRVGTYFSLKEWEYPSDQNGIVFSAYVLVLVNDIFHFMKLFCCIYSTYTLNPTKYFKLYFHFNLIMVTGKCNGCVRHLMPYRVSCSMFLFSLLSIFSAPCSASSVCRVLSVALLTVRSTSHPGSNKATFWDN